MKSIVGWVAVAVLAAAVLRAEERFSQTMSPAEFSAAGLDQLKPEQLARLDDLARAYQARALQQARPGEAAPLAGQPTVAQPKADQVQTGNSAQTPAGGSRVMRAKKPAPPPDPVAETSRIVGSIKGWDAHTVFTLENGEVWTVANSDRYNGPPMTNPSVQIRPASSFGGYWMRIESLPELRVRLLSSPDTPPNK